jgi:adenine-specific DNA-methyltransferase
MWELLRKRGNNSERKDSPKSFYPIYYDGAHFRLPIMEYDESEKKWIVTEKPAKCEAAYYPVDEKGVERNWRWGVETTKDNLSDLMCKENGSGTLYYKYRPPEGMTPTTNWIDAKYSSTEHGTGFLKKMFKEYALFSYPKSIYAVEDSLRVAGLPNLRAGTVLDYFAGSGTTGHAVINLNREDKGNRKYILVEMADYFNTVTKPRMQKAVYAAEWKDGKPTIRNTGISHIMKYLQLESYEDTLANIKLSDDAHKQHSGLFGEDYLVNYMLDVESKGSLINLDQFRAPFNYKLKITEKNETHEKEIDLVETFNYLIGLTVNKLRIKDDFKGIEGTLPDGQKSFVFWRNLSGNEERDDELLLRFFNELRKEIDFTAIKKIFVNGDSSLANMRQNNETFDVCLTEAVFKEKMFEV